MPTVYKRCGKSLNVNKISERRHAAVRLVYNEVASVTKQSRWYHPLLITGLIGAALFYGDGVITVLSH